MAKSPNAAPRSPSGRCLSSSAPPRWAHQDQSVEFFTRTPRAFDLSDPGTGKTRVHIERYAGDGQGRMLVLCPLTLMKAAWGEDIETFAPGINYTLAYAECREEAFEEKSRVVICNLDGVKWIAARLKKDKRFLSDFSDMVIDEFTGYKHPTSQRSKAAKLVTKHFDRRYELSGTPNPNSVTELWHPTLLLDEGKRLGTSFYHFRNQVQVAEQNGPMPNHVRWVDRPGAELAVTSLLSDITIRHRFEDVMTHVPPNHRNTKHYELRPKHRKLYEKFEKDAYILLENNAQVSAVHKSSLRNKLLQIASGAVYSGTDENGHGTYELLDTGRYELIADVAEQYRHSVVFFNWRHQKEQLEKEFKSRDMTFAVIDGSVPQKHRDEIVKRYQDGLLDSILLHPRTGAHGLTLTTGEATLFSSPFYEADLLQQAIRRIVRGTQDKVTNTVFFEAKGTVEQGVYERLLAKEGRMLDLLEIIRERTRDMK
jgi:SNF2 family DNA or RNA helicase